MLSIQWQSNSTILWFKTGGLLMNCIRMSILILITTIAGCSTQNIIQQTYNPNRIIHYSEIENIDNISNYVVYLNKGDKIPLKMTVDSDLLELNDDQINLILKQKVYFRVKMPDGINEEKISAMNEQEKQEVSKNTLLYVSADAKNWATISDVKAIKHIFGIEGGSFSIGMGMTKEDGVLISMSAKTNRME